MGLVAVGISHHTAPLEVRERLAVNAESVPRVLQQFHRDRLVREAVLISTCNRVELYAVSQVDADRLAGSLAESGGLRARLVGPHFYRFSERDALRHLFRVASSLDSLVIGEPQILAQVKEAYRVAAEARTAGPVLHRVMRQALQVGKRVRTETGIAREAVSVGRAGVELARQVLGELKGRSALLVGAGAHGKLVARSLLSFGLSELVVANRTFERAVDLARTFGASAAHLDAIGEYLPRVDVVVTSTGAGRVLISRSDVAGALRKRRYRPLVMIDLSVPRNIASDVNDLDAVYRFDIDDLRQVADRGRELRAEAAVEAERIVSDEVERCWRGLVGAEVNRRIGAVARHAEEVRVAEVARSRAVLDAADPAVREAVEAMSKALIKKLLHRPFTEARRMAESGESLAADHLLEALGGELVEGDEQTEKELE